MDLIQTKEKTFIGYEYKDITIKREVESLIGDGYANFGWEIENTSYSVQPLSSVTIKFKRNRKIRNKAELTRLQRQFDATVEEIQKLESSKDAAASTAAYIIGIVGTAFMAGSVFAVTSGNILLTAFLAVPAFIGWIIPYQIYRSIRQTKSQKISPLIDIKYDELYEITKQGNALLEN